MLIAYCIYIFNIYGYSYSYIYKDVVKLFVNASSKCFKNTSPGV